MDLDEARLLCGSVTDPKLFEVVFERHHQRIWAYLARRAGRERADELAGDVFVTAFRRRASYDPSRGSVSAWLYGIASHQLQTRFRSDARAARALRRAWAEQIADGAWCDRVDAAIDDRARLRRVIAALAAMPATDREVITLFAWERLSYEDIATIVGVEIGTVRSRLSRARARLRELVVTSGEETANAPCDGGRHG